LSLLLPISAVAQPASDEPQPAPESEPLPSLDELLGLEEDASSGVDPNDEALKQVLSPKEAGEALGQAVNLMNQVANRI
ncbi:unnamed protein product, partial [Laminaria digitata]